MRPEEQLSKDQLAQAFADSLEQAREHGVWTTDTGLSGDTEDAIMWVARAYPRADMSLVNAAEEAFARELDAL